MKISHWEMVHCPSARDLPWQRWCRGLRTSTPLRTGQCVPWLGCQLSPSFVGTPGQEWDGGAQGESTRCPLLRPTLGRQSQGEHGEFGGRGAGDTAPAGWWHLAALPLLLVVLAGAGDGAGWGCCPQRAVPSQLRGGTQHPWGATMPPWGPGA